MKQLLSKWALRGCQSVGQQQVHNLVNNQVPFHLFCLQEGFALPKSWKVVLRSAKELDELQDTSAPVVLVGTSLWRLGQKARQLQSRGFINIYVLSEDL